MATKRQINEVCQLLDSIEQPWDTLLNPRYFLDVFNESYRDFHFFTDDPDKHVLPCNNTIMPVSSHAIASLMRLVSAEVVAYDELVKMYDDQRAVLDAEIGLTACGYGSSKLPTDASVFAIGSIDQFLGDKKEWSLLRKQMPSGFSELLPNDPKRLTLEWNQLTVLWKINAQLSTAENSIANIHDMITKHHRDLLSLYAVRTATNDEIIRAKFKHDEPIVLETPQPRFELLDNAREFRQWIGQIVTEDELSYVFDDDKALADLVMHRCRRFLMTVVASHGSTRTAGDATPSTEFMQPAGLNELQTLVWQMLFVSFAVILYTLVKTCYDTRPAKVEKMTTLRSMIPKRNVSGKIRGMMQILTALSTKMLGSTLHFMRTGPVDVFQQFNLGNTAVEQVKPNPSLEMVSKFIATQQPLFKPNVWANLVNIFGSMTFTMFSYAGTLFAAGFGKHLPEYLREMIDDQTGIPFARYLAPIGGLLLETPGQPSNFTENIRKTELATFAAARNTTLMMPLISTMANQKMYAEKFTQQGIYELANITTSILSNQPLNAARYAFSLIESIPLFGVALTRESALSILFELNTNLNKIYPVNAVSMWITENYGITKKYADLIIETFTGTKSESISGLLRGTTMTSMVLLNAAVWPVISSITTRTFPVSRPKVSLPLSVIWTGGILGSYDGEKYNFPDVEGPTALTMFSHIAASQFMFWLTTQFPDYGMLLGSLSNLLVSGPFVANLIRIFPQAQQLTTFETMMNAISVTNPVNISMNVAKAAYFSFSGTAAEYGKKKRTTIDEIVMNLKELQVQLDKLEFKNIADMQPQIAALKQMLSACETFLTNLRGIKTLLLTDIERSINEVNPFAQTLAPTKIGEQEINLIEKVGPHLDVDISLLLEKAPTNIVDLISKLTTSAKTVLLSTDKSTFADIVPYVGWFLLNLERGVNQPPPLIKENYSIIHKIRTFPTISSNPKVHEVGKTYLKLLLNTETNEGVPEWFAGVDKTMIGNTPEATEKRIIRQEKLYIDAIDTKKTENHIRECVSLSKKLRVANEDDRYYTEGPFKITNLDITPLLGQIIQKMVKIDTINLADIIDMPKSEDLYRGIGKTYFEKLKSIWSAKNDYRFTYMMFDRTALITEIIRYKIRNFTVADMTWFPLMLMSADEGGDADFWMLGKLTEWIAAEIYTQNPTARGTATSSDMLLPSAHAARHIMKPSPGQILLMISRITANEQTPVSEYAATTSSSSTTPPKKPLRLARMTGSRATS